MIIDSLINIKPERHGDHRGFFAETYSRLKYFEFGVDVEFVQDKTDLLNSYQPGQQVKVSINLRGREWVNPQGETKYFNSIQGWRIESLDGSVSPDMPPLPPEDAFEPATDFNENDHDDLPF